MEQVEEGDGNRRDIWQGKGGEGGSLLAIRPRTPDGGLARLNLASLEERELPRHFTYVSAHRY
jgi:hypothetical protein